MESKVEKKVKGVRRPMNAFLIYCKRNRSKEREKNPDMDNRSITRMLGDSWAKLKPEEKAVFTKMAKESRDAFMKANPDYKWHSSDKSQGASKSSPASTSVSSHSKSSSEFSTVPQKTTKSMEQMGGLNLLLMAGQEPPLENIKPKHSASSQSSLGSTPKPVSSSCSTIASLTTKTSSSSSSGKAPVQSSSKDAEASHENNNALLQLAEMCTSELYSSAPGTSPNTSSSHAGMSSPLPPPKKRARQWSIDCSQREQQNPDSSKSSAKSASHNKKNDAGPAHKKVKTGSKHTHSAAESSPAPPKMDRKQKNSSALQQTAPLPTVNPPLETRPLPLFGNVQTPANTHGPDRVESQSVAASAEDQRLVVPQPLPLTGLFSARCPLERPVLKTQGFFPFAELSGRDMPEKVLDLRSSRNSPKLMEALSSGFIPEKKFKPSSLINEGKIASLLSSPHPLAGIQAISTKPEATDTKLATFSGLAAASQPLTLEKLPKTETSSISLPKEANVPCGVTQPFTEGKLKKKWTQRMMVEAKKEEDEALQAASYSNETVCPSLFGQQHSLRPPVSVKQENIDLTKDSQISISSNNTFLYAKPQIRSESSMSSSNGSDPIFHVPKDYTFQNLNANNSSSPDIVKSERSEALQSNTLYRALMGQTPSHFSTSTYAPKNTVSSSFSNNSENATPKTDEDKKVFTPITDCGKKMMDHIVERLFQSGQSVEVKDLGSAERTQAQCITPPPSSISSAYVASVPLPPPMKFSSLANTQISQPLSSISSNNLVEKIVTKMFEAAPTQDTGRFIGANHTTKMEMENPLNNGNESHRRKDLNTQSTSVDEMKKDKDEDDLSSSKMQTNERKSPTEGVYETNNGVFLEDLNFQPVRKSRRANRGQKYQALIKEGIIQPSKERLAARNAERNVKSCSSREDIDKCEPKRIMKRCYSEREPPHVAMGNNYQVSAAAHDTGISDLSKEFDLEKEIASLPTCSYEQFEKKKMQPARRTAECYIQKPDVKGSNSQLPKATSVPVDLPKKDAIMRSSSGKAASCHASIKELGCHTVHIPLLTEERPAENLTGSRKRKARRHVITRISVAPPQGGEKSERSATPGSVPVPKALLSEKNSIGGTEKKKNKIKTDAQKAKGPSSVPGTAKARSGADILTPKTISPFDAAAPCAVSNNSSHLAQHDFPALTLLSSVMIDSEKAVFPACKNKALSTTQSPTPASLARSWPIGADSIHVTASKPSLQPTPASNASSNSSFAVENAHLMKMMVGFSSHSQTPSAARITTPSTSSYHTSVVSSSSKERCLPSSWPMYMASTPQPSSITSTASAIFRSSSTLLTPALNQLPLPSAVPMLPGVSVQPPNSMASTATSVSLKSLPATATPQAYIISTLPPSRNTELPPDPSPKMSMAANKQATTRRKKAQKGCADEKLRAEVNSFAPTVSQETLNPGTKKLVKLLLKDNGLDESCSRLGMENNAVMSQPSDGKQNHQNADPAQPRRKQPPKGAKGKGRSGTEPETVIPKMSSPPQCLSLKAQLEVGQILASEKQVDSANKKRKPTIWDHLNSPGLLPMNSTMRTPQNLGPPPAKKKCLKPMPSNGPNLPKSTLQPNVQKSSVNIKAPNKDSICSDTESASEETEDRASSGTDSAEETDIVSPQQAGVKNHSRPASTQSVSKSNSNINPQSPCTPPTTIIKGQTSILPNSQPPYPPKSGPSLSSGNQPPLSSSASGILSRNVNGGRAVSQQPTNGQFEALKSLDGHKLPHPSPPMTVKPVSQAPDISLPQQAIAVRQQASHSSSPAVYLPVIVTTTDSNTHATCQDTSKSVIKSESVVSTACHSHAPKIPKVLTHPLSTGTETVMYDAKASASLLEGGASRNIGSSPCLPGSPSVAAV